MEEKTKENEIKEENTVEETIDKEDSENGERESKKSKKLKEKVKLLEDEVNTWKNKYYQAYADMDNLRKLMEKDHQQVLKYRGQGFLETLLPVFDNFYMAFKVKPSDPALEAYCRGFEMIYNQMVASLESEGVKEIVPQIGAKFDHNQMQAVDVVEGEQDDVVMNVANKGYLYKDRLVRPAMVVVSKVKKTEEEGEKNDSSKVN